MPSAESLSDVNQLQIDIRFAIRQQGNVAGLDQIGLKTLGIGVLHSVNAIERQNVIFTRRQLSELELIPLTGKLHFRLSVSGEQ